MVPVQMYSMTESVHNFVAFGVQNGPKLCRTRVDAGSLQEAGCLTWSLHAAPHTLAAHCCSSCVDCVLVRQVYTHIDTCHVCVRGRGMFQTCVASGLTHTIAECSHTSEGKFAGVQGQGESWQSFNQASVVVHAHVSTCLWKHWFCIIYKSV